MCVISPVFCEGTLFGFCGSIAHKSDIGGPVPGSCSGQARETFNEGLHLPAVRYQRGFKPIGDIDRIIGANSRTPELVLGDIRGQLVLIASVSGGLTSSPRNTANQKCSPASIACSRSQRLSSARASPNGRTAASRPSALSMTTASTWKSRFASMSWWRRQAIASISISPARPIRPRAPPMCARRWCRPHAPIA